MSQHKFKVGDKIRPIKEMCEELDYIDQVYTVERWDLDSVDLDKDFTARYGKCGWWSRRFELDKNYIVSSILKDL